MTNKLKKATSKEVFLYLPGDMYFKLKAHLLSQGVTLQSDYFDSYVEFKHNSVCFKASKLVSGLSIYESSAEIITKNGVSKYK